MNLWCWVEWLWIGFLVNNVVLFLPLCNYFWICSPSQPSRSSVSIPFCCSTLLLVLWVLVVMVSCSGTFTMKRSEVTCKVGCSS